MSQKFSKDRVSLPKCGEGAVEQGYMSSPQLLENTHCFEGLCLITPHLPFPCFICFSSVCSLPPFPVTLDKKTKCEEEKKKVYWEHITLKIYETTIFVSQK